MARAAAIRAEHLAAHEALRAEAQAERARRERWRRKTAIVLGGRYGTKRRGPGEMFAAREPRRGRIVGMEHRAFFD